MASYIRRELTGQNIDVYLATDSLNLRDHIRCYANNVSEKRLKIDLVSLKHSFVRGDIKRLLWLGGTENPSDSLTKPTPILARVLRTGHLDFSTLI